MSRPDLRELYSLRGNNRSDGLLQNTQMRSFFRRSGLKKLYYTGRKAKVGAGEYEKRYSKALLSSIQPGDCVWDIGANVGFYTEKFATLVGPSGTVVAFEPFQEAFQQLSAATAAFHQASCHRIALGAEICELRVEPVAPLSTVNSLAHTGDSDAAELISVRTGARLLRDGLPAPNVLKLDVEGFEEDVIWGFGDALRDPTCRSVFVEVHFGSMEKRGMRRAPARVVSRLRDLGFSTRWVDPSHLAATRASSVSAA